MLLHKHFVLTNVRTCIFFFWTILLPGCLFTTKFLFLVLFEELVSFNIDKQFVFMARYMLQYEMVSSALGLLVQEIQQCHLWHSFRCLCVFYRLLLLFMALGLVFFPHLQFLYVNSDKFNKNTIKFQWNFTRTTKVINSKGWKMLYLIIIFELFKFDVTKLADVCVAFIILTISHHHHLPSNHLCIADILVALSMFLFFDSIIQNYFTGIKIVYINYGFFLQLPIYIHVFWKTL